MSADLRGTPWETSVRSDGSEWHVVEAGGGDCVALILETDDKALTERRANVLAEAPAMYALLLRAADDPRARYTENGLKEDARAILARIEGAP